MSASAFGVDIRHFIMSFMIAVLMAMYGYTKKPRALSKSGAVAAILVGTVTFYCGMPFGVLLIAFFVSSSRITKMNMEKKRRLEADFKEGGERTWIQVMANGIIGTGVAFVHYWWFDVMVYPLHQDMPLSMTLQLAYLAHYAACAGDTWASELGITSSSPPRLVTTCRTVPAGTNGGISTGGTIASVAGGLMMGITWYLTVTVPLPPSIKTPPHPWLVYLPVVVGALAGFIGSMIDSLLGATLQYSGWDPRQRVVVYAKLHDEVKHITGYNLLDNHMVNFFSALITTCLFALAIHTLAPPLLADI